MSNKTIIFFLSAIILVLFFIIFYQQFIFRHGIQTKIRSEEHTSELQSH